jgi:hypothetical protein
MLLQIGYLISGKITDGTFEVHRAVLLRTRLLGCDAALLGEWFPAV